MGLLIIIGTSHSIVWTSAPIERRQITRHKPFCLDLHEHTFELLKNFLHNYSNSFYDASPPSPFQTSLEHHRFVLQTLKLLNTHFRLCINGGLNNTVLKEQATGLRTLLFG